MIPKEVVSTEAASFLSVLLDLIKSGRRPSSYQLPPSVTYCFRLLSIASSSYELPPSSDGGKLPARKASAEKQKMHTSAVLQLKLFGSKPLFVFRLKPSIVLPNLRLKPEAIDKKS